MAGGSESDLWPELKEILRTTMDISIEKIRATQWEIIELDTMGSVIQQQQFGLNTDIKKNQSIIDGVDAILNHISDLSAEFWHKLDSVRAEHRITIQILDDAVKKLAYRASEVYHKKRLLENALKTRETIFKRHKFHLSWVNSKIKGIYGFYSIKKVRNYRKHTVNVASGGIYEIDALWKQVVTLTGYGGFPGENIIFIAHREAIERILGREFIKNALTLLRITDPPTEIKGILDGLLKNYYEEEDG